MRAAVKFSSRYCSWFRSRCTTEIQLNTHLDLLGPRNGDDIFSLRKEPCERHLSRRRVVLFSNLLKFFYQLQDLGEVFLRVSVYQSYKMNILP